MTYQRRVFETAAEFLDACEAGELPSSVYVVHDGETPWLSGDGAKAFGLEGLDWSELIMEMLKRAGISVHFT